MKNKKILVRILLMILTLSLCVSSFFACSKKEEEVTDTTVSTDTGDDGEKYDSKGYLLDSLPELDFQKEVVNILCWNAENSEFDVEFGNNVIDNSIYNSNKTTEERLNIKLSYEKTNGSVKYVSDYKQKVANAYNGGEYWDVIASYTRSTAVCASGGLLKNLGALGENSYLDFDKPWWNKDVIEKTSVGSAFYFCTGDISTNFIQMTYCMYFNADMLKNNDITSPYTYVANNQWTLETLKTISKKLYNDNNENNQADVYDTFAITGSYFAYPALLHGCDVPIVEKNSAGSFVVTDAYKGEKALHIMDDVLNTMVSDKSAFVTDNDKTSSSIFTSGNAAFLITESATALNNFSNVGFEYGCVPCPKYDESQTQYYSTVRQPITLYGIMGNLPEARIGLSTATLECLASHRYRQTTPIIFDDCMKYLRSQSADMTEMLQLVRDTAFFDCARIYAQETGYICDRPGYCLQDGTTWADYVNQNMTNIENKVSQLSTKLQSVAMQ